MSRYQQHLLCSLWWLANCHLIRRLFHLRDVLVKYKDDLDLHTSCEYGDIGQCGVHLREVETIIIGKDKWVSVVSLSD